MNPDRRHDVERLLNSALDLAPKERSTYLAQACLGDESLRMEVERLMTNDSEARAFMASHALNVAARALGKDLLGSTNLTGQTVRHYRIMEKIGSGGMGEVYRAHDSHLKRDVAIKVLPDVFSGDPERLARFDREAKLLATLNHPNIAAIYGLERTDSGPLLVMELVDGETLAQRIAKGP
jgi:hypothetical protein